MITATNDLGRLPINFFGCDLSIQKMRHREPTLRRIKMKIRGLCLRPITIHGPYDLSQSNRQCAFCDSLDTVNIRALPFKCVVRYSFGVYIVFGKNTTNISKIANIRLRFKSDLKCLAVQDLNQNSEH
ncbi:hypothetical protein STEG23_028635 [Scotinomys teguina]